MLGTYTKGLALAAVVLLGGCTAAAKTNLNDTKLGLSKPASALAFQADTSFGDGLSEKEISELTAAEIKALEYGKSGEKIDWRGDRDTVSGSVVAFHPFRVGLSNCRRFQHQLVDVKDKRQATGTACKRDAQAWKLIQ